MGRANELTRSALNLLALRGAFAVRSNQIPVHGRTFTARKGRPDVEAVMPDGKYLGVEIKTTDKQRPEQAEWQHEVTKRNGYYLILRDIDPLITWLDAMYPPVKYFSVVKHEKSA